MPRENTITFRGARVIFRNFAGKEGPYNREGDRNFCVLLEEEVAAELDADGWNVKALRAREEGDPEQPYLPVTVSFRNRPPKVVLVTSRGRTELSENEIELLDWADVVNWDMIVRPYEWEVNGKKGIKAYLKSIYVTIEEDELELQYADLNELPSRSGRVDE